jgi:uncharacterized protein involved in outer membrane biogenesis
VVWLKRVGWGVAALLLAWGLAWLAVPALLKWQGQQRLGEMLGRPVTIERVGFAPWTLELTVENLAIGQPGQPVPTDPLLAFSRLRVDAALSSLFRRAPVIEALELDGLALRLARTGPGRYDIDDLIERFRPVPDEPAGEPQRFALYNLQLRGASVHFDDRPVERVHRIEAVQLSLPFLSNLPAQVEVKVEPRLAFRVGNTAFDTGALAIPFAATRSAEITLRMGALDLAPYLAYQPEALPLRLREGELATDIRLKFALPDSGEPTLALQGGLQARRIRLADAADQPMLGWEQLALELKDVQPLARRAALGSVQIDGLHLHLRRGADGVIDWTRLGTGPAPAPPAKPPARAASPSTATKPASRAASAAAAPGKPPAAWQFALDRLELNQGTVFWRDDAVRPAAALQLDISSFHADAVAWPATAPVALRLAGSVRRTPAEGQAVGEVLGTLGAEGRAGPTRADITLALSKFSLGALAPYLAEVLTPRLEGELSAEGRIDWTPAAAAGGTATLQLRLAQARLDQLRLLAAGTAPGARGAPLASLRQLALDGLLIDLPARNVSLERVSLQQPSMQLARTADGRWNVQDWLAAAASPGPATPGAAADKSDTAPWRIGLKALTVQGGLFSLSDARPATAPGAEPVQLQLALPRLGLQDLAWPAERRTPPMGLQLSARVGAAPSADDRSPATGTLDWQGQVGLSPLLARGKLKAERLPVHSFGPYFADHLPLALVRAEAGFDGELAVQLADAGLSVTSRGDVLLGDVQVHARQVSGQPGDELLNWQRLALQGLQFDQAPGTKPRLVVRESTLSDFFSRLVITEDGRFNLQDVAAAPADPPAAAPGAASGASAAAPAAQAAAAPTGLPIELQLGPTRLVNGRIDFTDRFIRPNYSADLTALNGRLGSFRSDSPELAELELRGRAAGTALLDISGRLNPTAQPLALDIRARATDLELAPLSPYAGKYAGYAIERGKLSMDLAYKIEPDGKLDAKNQVVLNQLTFGDKIESPQATKLPVLLAVALLKDRNGVIDINLPVSGSINDPQFSVGGLILRVIVNLLTKALTAPFALLAGGGSDDLSLVEFQPGTALPSASSAAVLDKVAKALTERPALKMTVTGAADPVGEAEAYRREAFEARLQAERRRERVRAGQVATVAAAPASAPASGPVAAASDPPPPLTPADRERLLRLVYRQTTLPNKPKNLIGLTKDIPPAEMEALLKATIEPSPEALRELALQRGLAVRDALMQRGLPAERLFLAAPKLRAGNEAEAGWTPRVQLSLSTN